MARRPIVLVTGGHQQPDGSYVFRVLDKHDPQLVVCGSSLGADRFAEIWAHKMARDFLRCEVGESNSFARRDRRMINFARALEPILNRELRVVVLTCARRKQRNCGWTARRLGIPVCDEPMENYR